VSHAISFSDGAARRGSGEHLNGEHLNGEHLNGDHVRCELRLKEAGKAISKSESDVFTADSSDVMVV